MASIPFEFPTLINLHVIQNLRLVLCLTHCELDIKLQRGNSGGLLRWGGRRPPNPWRLVHLLPRVLLLLPCSAPSRQSGHTQGERIAFDPDWRVFPSAFLNTNFPNMWQYSIMVHIRGGSDCGLTKYRVFEVHWNIPDFLERINNLKSGTRCWETVSFLQTCLHSFI